MARKPKAPRETPRDDHAANHRAAPDSPGVDEVIGKLKRHLDEGQPKSALEQIGRSGIKSPWLTNAAAVCQMRLGNTEVAVETLRSLVVQGGVHLRDDVPPAFKLNFAAALLAAGNLDGFLSAVNEVGDDEHPSARRYREAYRRWRASLSVWEKVKASLRGTPARPFVLDFPPGELS